MTRLVVGPTRVKLIVVDHGPDRIVRLSAGVAGPAGPTGPQGQTGGGLWVWDAGEADYVLATGARIFLRYSGDPAPSGLVRNDIVLVDET